MKLFAVTGHPVLHSRSPAIFHGLFAAGGLDACYTRVGAGTAAGALALARNMGLAGFNVTSPFKEDFYRLAATRDATAERLEAANTVMVGDGGDLTACNTDPDGIAWALARGGVEPRGQQVVVVGTGGAARAAAATLVAAGARVVMVSRDAARATQAASRLGCDGAGWEDLRALTATAAGLVSCLPVGVEAVREEWLRPALWVLDANYGRSALADAAARRRATVLDAQDWLAGQAAAAFRVFACAWDPASAGSAGGRRHAVRGPSTCSDGARSAQAGSGLEEGGDRRETAGGRQETAGGFVAEISASRSAREASTAGPGLALAGMMGCGKSTVATRLGHRLGWEVVDVDTLIVGETGCEIDRLFAERGEAGFRRIESETIARVVSGRRAVVALGGGSLGDGETVRRVRRACRIVWLWAPPACLAARTAADGVVRPLLGEGRHEARLAALLALRTPAYASAADLVVDAERPLEDVADLIAFEVTANSTQPVASDQRADATAER